LQPVHGPQSKAQLPHVSVGSHVPSRLHVPASGAGALAAHPTTSAASIHLMQASR
jgi:hypothetical protein